MMFRNDSHETFVEKFKESRPDAEAYTFLTEYIASTAPITVRHDACGTEFTVSAVSLIRKQSPSRCPVCYSRKAVSKTIKEIKNELASYGHGSFQLLDSQIIDDDYLLTIKHKPCDNVFKIKRSEMLKEGLHCDGCEANGIPILVEKHRSIVIPLRISVDSKGAYEVVSAFKGYDEPIKIHDNRTEATFEMIYSDFIDALYIEFPQRIFDEVMEDQAIGDYLDNYVLSQSDGRYEILNPYKYEGLDDPVTIYDTELDEEKYITYEILKKLLEKKDKADKEVDKE